LEAIGALKAGARHAAEDARGKMVRDNLEDSIVGVCVGVLLGAMETTEED